MRPSEYCQKSASEKYLRLFSHSLIPRLVCHVVSDNSPDVLQFKKQTNRSPSKEKDRSLQMFCIFDKQKLSLCATLSLCLLNFLNRLQFGRFPNGTKVKTKSSTK